MGPSLGAMAAWHGGRFAEPLLGNGHGGPASEVEKEKEMEEGEVSVGELLPPRQTWRATLLQRVAGWTQRRGRSWGPGKISFWRSRHLCKTLVVLLAATALISSALRVPQALGLSPIIPWAYGVYRTIHAMNMPLQVSEADLKLFQEALAVSKAHAQPMSQQKIAFLFLTRGELPFAPLWARFFKGHEGKYSIYIHTQVNYTYGPKELPPMFQGRTIPNEATQWGGLSLVGAERRLLAHALLDPSNWYFALFSESCIPIYNFTTVFKRITRSAYSFTTQCENKALWKWDMLPDVPLRDWRKGDQWKEVHRSLALEIIRDQKLFRRFTGHCYCSNCNWHKVGVMDEHYIPTLLHKVAKHKLANYSLTYVDWKNHDDWLHPHKFSAKEVTPALLKELRGIRIASPLNLFHVKIQCMAGGKPSPCYLFARKFAPEAIKPLMKLAKTSLYI